MATKEWPRVHNSSTILSTNKLQDKGFKTGNFYPHFSLTDTPNNFKGINNILFFYSLLEKRNSILRYDIIQGTTYTPLAFLRFSKPVISHFGSTTIDFLRAVPKTGLLESREKKGASKKRWDNS